MLAAHQAAQRRWMSCLKRAFHAVERLQAGIARCENRSLASFPASDQPTLLVLAPLVQIPVEAA